MDWHYGDYVKINSDNSFYNGTAGNVIAVGVNAITNQTVLTVQLDYGQTLQLKEHEVTRCGSVVDAVKEALEEEIAEATQNEKPKEKA